jgi:hypothetical protein
MGNADPVREQFQARRRGQEDQDQFQVMHRAGFYFDPPFPGLFF